MVYRRRFQKRRRSYGRKRFTARRSFKRGRRARVRRGNRLNCKRGTTPANYACWDRDNFYGASFTLSDTPTYADFTNLFDLWKLNCVVARFRFDRSPPDIAAGAATTNTVPILRWYTDDTDAIPPATVNAMAEVQNYKQRPLIPGRKIAIKIYPKYAKSMYQTAVTTGYGPGKGWVNSTDYNVPHFGLKWCLDGSAGGGIGTIRLGTVTLERTYYFSFRSTK